MNEFGRANVPVAPAVPAGVCSRANLAVPLRSLSDVRVVGKLRLLCATNKHRANKIFTSFATDTRTFFGHRAFHQENDERHSEYHDGEQPKAIEICQRCGLLVTQVL